MDPNDARGWISKGDILFRMNKKEESIDCLNKGLEIDPKLESAYNILLEIYYNDSQIEELTTFTKKALEIYPNNIKFRMMLSEALLLKMELINAEEEIKKALELTYEEEYIEPAKISPLYEQLGVISVMRGHREKALEYFAKAIEINKRDDWSYKLFSAFICLDSMGTVMNGSPLERRARLLKWADLRMPSVARNDFYDFMGI